MEKVSPNMDVKFNIVPQVTITDPVLKRISIQTRKCLFSQESSLEYFKHYTFTNCELECISKQSRDICNCVEFWIPSKFGKAKVCGENYIHFELHKFMSTFISSIEGNGTDSQAYCWMHGLTNIITNDQIRFSLSKY